MKGLSVNGSPYIHHADLGQKYGMTVGKLPEREGFALISARLGFHWSTMRRGAEKLIM